MIDFIQKWNGERTGLRSLQIVGWVGIARSKFYDWRARFGKANEHNAWIARDHWTEAWERERIVEFARQFPLEGYRRLTLTPPPPGAAAPCGLPCGRLSRGFPAPRLKEFVRIAGLTHIKTSPYYPQSNGKIERWHQSLKAGCIRPGTPLDVDHQARRLIASFVEHSNTVRLHSAIGYITPQDKLLGKEKAIFAARDQKLAQARLQRKIKRQNQPAHSVNHQLNFSN